MAKVGADKTAPAAQAGGRATAKLAQFFIPATASLQERRPRTLKHGDMFALFDHNGDAVPGPGSPEGLYYRDTRYLSHLYLTLQDQRPILLSSTLRDDNATLSVDLTNPDLHDDTGRVILAHDLVHLRRSRFLWNTTCFERLTVTNFDPATRRLRLQISFAADFVDVFEVRGTHRERRGTLHPPVVLPDRARLAYTGLDGLRRETVLRFDPAPDEIGEARAVFDLEIRPRETKALFIEICCGSDSAAPTQYPAFFVALRDARRSLRLAAQRAASLTTSNVGFNEAVRRSVSDLAMLTTDTEHGPYPYAGIPWFSTVFGRDALITALQVLWMDPSLARGVLRFLAANQATRLDPPSDAEPGKILHEVRQGEMAELGEVPFRRYYGSVDSTPLFVLLAGAYFERTGDLATIGAIWPNIDAALRWMQAEGDRDADGFVEYGRMTRDGLVNQGWKDSHDSIFHADGRMAHGPIALAEVQAYVYGARQSAARIARALGHHARAVELERLAESLRVQFDQAFFDESLGTYVLALDGDKKPCRVRTSNAGHALLTGIAFPERAQAVVRTLMAGSSFSGWGVRTVAATEFHYNPMSYHNGSVWPHDNALIGAGLARYGFRREAARILAGLYDASRYIDLRRLPELFCGFARPRSQGPTFYPVACSPQAWSASALLSLLQSCLGLHFDVGAGTIVFDRPHLPEMLDEVTLRQLSLGTGAVDIALKRVDSEVVVNVLSHRGTLRVMTMN